MNRIHNILNACENIVQFDQNANDIHDQWSQYLSSPLDIKKESAHYDEVSRRIADLSDRLASIQIPGERVFDSVPHNAAHLLHLVLSSISYRFSDNEHQLTKEESQLVAHMKAHGFIPFTDAQKSILHEKCFNKIFRLLDAYCKKQEGKANSHSTPVVREGYASGVAAKYPLTQHFCPCVQDENLEDLKNAFSESRFDQVLKELYGSNFCVSNIRVWQYYRDEQSKKSVRPHYDALPTGTFKVMTFDGDITPAHGCFEVLKNVPPPHHRRRAQVLYQTVGNNPGVLVDANNQLHQGLVPKPGFKRKSIELSIMPLLDPNKTLYQDAGCTASAPWNPFELGKGFHNRTVDPMKCLS